MLPTYGRPAKSQFGKSPRSANEPNRYSVPSTALQTPSQVKNFPPLAAPHHGDAADTQSDKQENCTKQNVWDSIAKYLNNLSCQGHTSRDRINLGPHSLSVRSITVNETHLVNMQVEDEAIE